jgi:hypothetical protein
MLFTPLTIQILTIILNETFHNEIALDCSKLGKRHRIFFFRNEGQESKIGGSSHSKRFLNILYHFNEIIFDGIPT